MSQNSAQSAPSNEEQYAAALAAKLNAVLAVVDPEIAGETDAADAAEEERAATVARAKSPAPRVSRKEARARLKLRLESIPGFDRHSRKCQICNHPEIEDLEDEFLNWASAHWIKKAFKLSDESTIYRHARATGLDVVRRKNLGFALEKIVQEIDHLEAPTVTEVIRAVRTLARLNSRGQWVFPPATPPGALLLASERIHEPSPNRQTYQELEMDVTHTKQTREVPSNRQS